MGSALTQPQVFMSAAGLSSCVVVRVEDIEWRPSFMDLMMKHYRDKLKEMA